MSPVLFISSVTAEFGDLRRRLGRLLERTKRVHVRHQDDFFNRGVPTLQMLEEEIRSSNCVLHLIGEQSGWTPPPDQVRSFLERHPDFLRRFPDFATDDRVHSMSATQWEAWLAAFFGIERVVCLALSPTEHDMRLQQPHLEMLNRHHIHPTIAPARTQLFEEIIGLLVEFGYLDTHPQPQHSHASTTIGQRDEVENIKTFFSFADTVIIWGPGGSGKTTLARSLSADYQDRRVTVLWVDLLRVTSADGIYFEILKSMDGAPILEGQPQSDSIPLSKRVATALRQIRTALLVLDNAEHVRTAIPAVIETIRSCGLSTLKTAITSQYNFAAECDDIPCIPIDPLSHATPDQQSEWNAESVARMEATRLFVSATRGRIRQLTPETWEPIARICHVFRGHPLSISLAAGELASSPRLTLNDLAERIQSNPAKGTMSNLSADFDYKTKSLAASVRWSMSLCSEAEQRFLYAVAYLTDGFTEECGNRIRASSTHAHDETIRSVAHFCNASLLQALPRGRFRLIECVRTELEASANAGGSEHLERCLDALTEEIRLCGCDGLCDPSHESLVTLASERGNVRRLVAAALSDSDLSVKAKGMILLAEYLPALCRIDMPQYITDTYSACLKWTHLLPLPLACRLVRLISRSMWAIGQWTDAASLIHDLIEQNRASFRTTSTAGIEWGWHDCCDLALLLSDRVRLGCLASRHGSFVNRQMSFDDLMVMISEADTLCHLRRHFAPDNALTRKREASLRALIAERRAQVLDSNGSYALAAECVHQIASDRMGWSLLSTQQQGEIKNRLGLACWHAGQLDTAEECFRHAASLFSKAGDTMWQAGALTNLAFVMTDLEMFASSIQCCETAEGLHKAVGNLVWEAINLGAWGNALAWSGDHKLGLARLEQGLTLLKAADPDTRAQFSGDIARVLLFHNTAHTDARAKLLLEQALAFQTNSGKPTRRMFGNTVLLAHAGYRLARPISELQVFARQARQIATELGLTDQSPVLQVRRDLTLLNRIEMDLSQHTDAQS